MKKWLILVIPAVALTFLGCGLISGVFTIDHEFDEIQSSSDGVHLDIWDKVFVDLNDNSTYKDHKDKLKGIESACLSTTVKNNLNQNVSGEVWISYDEFDSKSALIAGGGQRIFHGIALGPNEERRITCADMADILDDGGLDVLEDAIEVGQFWVYGFGNEDEYNVTFKHNVLILAVAAGL
ncbi:hypothetical protein KKG05_08105 [bacterium]|nr:hypothetical protein [bacterium]